MATTFPITSENNQQLFQDISMKGAATTYRFDASQWAEQNHAISTATWSVEAGNATVSGQALSSSVASALVTFSESGPNLIKVILDSGTEKFVAFLDVLAKNPLSGTLDYGMVI